jgi:hypothetical protein
MGSKRNEPCHITRGPGIGCERYSPECILRNRISLPYKSEIIHASAYPQLGCKDSEVLLPCFDNLVADARPMRNIRVLKAIPEE